MHYFSNLFDKEIYREIVHLVDFHYKNLSQCTVLCMSNVQKHLHTNLSADMWIIAMVKILSFENNSVQ